MRYFFNELPPKFYPGKDAGHKSMEPANYAGEKATIIRYYAMPVLVLPGILPEDLLQNPDALNAMIALCDQIGVIQKIVKP